MRIHGTQVVPARISELRRVLLDVSADDMSQLDPALGAAMDRPLGRELLAARLPVAESVFVCLHNIEPGGLIVLHRTDVGAQVRALAVSPDLRRNGLARRLLAEAEKRARERGLEWLWMQAPSANVPATRCALACGFRRYRPQFLRRTIGNMISAPTYRIRLDRVHGEEAASALTQWYQAEVAAGDAWVQPLIEAELLPLVLPSAGQVWRCFVDDRELGSAHMMGTLAHPIISLWLDRQLWDTQEEIACLRAVLNTLSDMPPALDVWLGSEGHLRASVARYKAHGFKPVLDERVFFVKRIQPLPEA